MAPKMMVVGTSYSDTGSFKGSFGGDMLGVTIAGSYGGKATASAKLFGRTSITVGSKTYAYAVKGVMVIGMNGTVTLSVDGESMSINMNATATRTFWAVPGKGVVKMQESFVMNVAVPGEASAKITVNTTSKLSSYVLPT
jgi:hypothetical protein